MTYCSSLRLTPDNFGMTSPAIHDSSWYNPVLMA